MQTDGLLALSALVTGIALAGALAGVRIPATHASRISLLAVFALMAGLCALPLAVAVQPVLYTYYMPALLPLMFSLPVAVLSYARSRLQNGPVLRNWRRDSVLPLAGLGVMLGYWILPAPDRTTVFVDGDLPAGWAPAALTLLTFALVLIWVLASLAYLIATVRALRRYRAHLKTVYSNTEAYELRWIDGFLALLVALWAAAALTLLSENLALSFLTPDTLVFGLAGAVLLLLIAFALSPAPQAAPLPKLAPSDDASAGKYTRSALTEDRADQIAQRIVQAMQRDQLYLDPNLSLQKLARHVSTPPNLVSQTLNETLGLTFFDFVAHWRITAAKPLIIAGEHSVLAVALEVGFNTRSTFYKAFKRETGQTPKAFRDGILSEANRNRLTPQ